MALTINNVPLDDPRRAFVIAEASGNHNKDYHQAVALVYAAADAGADAIKFQLITPDLICADIPLPFGHSPAHDAWLRSLGVTRMPELFAKGGLPRAWCAPLKELAEGLGIAWLCTPFSLEEARFLVEEVGVKALKIASGDLTFTPLLRYASEETTLPLIVSTGGATLDECRRAIRGPLLEAWWQSRLVLLHCCSIYPAPEAMVNLQAITTLRDAFGLETLRFSHVKVAIGFSDHTLDTDIVPAVAASLGCCVYEKHFTLDRSSSSIDGDHSLEPDEFKKMVEVLRKVPFILGDGVKKPHPLENHDRAWARRDPSDWRRPTREAREGAWE